MPFLAPPASLPPIAVPQPVLVVEASSPELRLLAAHGVIAFEQFNNIGSKLLKEEVKADDLFTIPPMPIARTIKVKFQRIGALPPFQMDETDL